MGTSIATVQQEARMAQAKRPDIGKNAEANASAKQQTAIINMIRDTNNDGVVSRAEKNAYKAQVEQFRAEIDKNGDGEVSFAEEVNFAVKNKQVTSGEISHLLGADTDQNGKISTAEETAWVEKRAALEAIRAKLKP
jgi:hypothetical protein